MNQTVPQSIFSPSLVTDLANLLSRETTARLEPVPMVKDKKRHRRHKRRSPAVVSVAGWCDLNSLVIPITIDCGCHMAAHLNAEGRVIKTARRG